jgi:hypothetical protein
LSFWWVGKNGVCDVYIQDMDGQQHLLHSLHDWYANNNDWNHSIIDLKQYQREKSESKSLYGHIVPMRLIDPVFAG